MALFLFSIGAAVGQDKQAADPIHGTGRNLPRRGDRRQIRARRAARGRSRRLIRATLTN
jgi:hypothetical protein